ncbi:MAG: 3'-5' exoribonuclease [Pirellulales bacterium]|nr:3'-5' exoribonuclease [Pirellulales bacterium]
MNDASMPLNESEFIAFDLETTGLHPVGSQIVEIGAVRFLGDGTVLEHFQQLVDPKCIIPKRVIWIHGITNEMVAGQPVISEVLPRFVDFLGDTSVIMMAHNAGFDLDFLSFAFNRLGQMCPSHPVIDTCTLARHRLSLPDYKLETIGRYLRFIKSEKHRALDDAMLLKDVFLHLIRKQPSINRTDGIFKISPSLSFDLFAAVLDDPPKGYEKLWEAIAEQCPVEIKYVGGSTPCAKRVVTPLGLQSRQIDSANSLVRSRCH